MFGFAVGDLDVRRPNARGVTLTVGCKVDSYDEHVHLWLRDWFDRIGVSGRLVRVAEAGKVRANAPPFPRDLWRTTVNARLDLLRLIATLEPFMRHAKRRSNAFSARANILERTIPRD